MPNLGTGERMWLLVGVLQEIHTKVVGVTKRNDESERIQELLEGFELSAYEGMPILLEHEEDNEYDENAIKVILHCSHIGYLNRELAAEIVDAVDEDCVEAELSEITGGEDGKSYGCNILLRILDTPSEQSVDVLHTKPELPAELVEAARSFVTTVPTVSVATLQRQFSLGYTNAAALMDKLEELGDVGTYKAGGIRDVLTYNPKNRKLIDRIFKPVMITCGIIIVLCAVAIFAVRSMRATSPDRSGTPQLSNLPTSTQASKTTQATPTPSPTAKAAQADNDGLKDKAVELLADTYAADDIVSVSAANKRLSVKISDGGLGAATEAPENWGDITAAAETACAVLLDGWGADDYNTATIQMVDSEDNILLTVVNGRVSYSKFAAPADYSQNAPTISLKEFNAIQTGMSYDEVFEIVGSRGEVLSEVDMGLGDEYVTMMFTWEGEGSIGANANVTFQGGKVASKAQFGLE